MSSVDLPAGDMTVPEFIVEFAKLVAPGLPTAIALLAGLYIGHVLTRRQSREDFDRQRDAAREDRETLRTEFVEDRNREREMFVADRAEDRKAEVDREQRDWERQIVREVCAPAMASIGSACDDLLELSVFVDIFRAGDHYDGKRPRSSQGHELAGRTLGSQLQMIDDVTRVTMEIGLSTSTLLLTELARLSDGPVASNMASLLDGKHDDQVEMLDKKIRSRIIRYSNFRRVLGNLVLNPPPSNSPVAVKAFEDSVRSFLRPDDPESADDSEGSDEKPAAE